MAYLHCVPPINSDEYFSPGMSGFQRGGIIRQNTTLAVVDLVMENQPTATNSQKNLAENRRKGFPPASNSSRLKQKSRMGQRSSLDIEESKLAFAGAQRSGQEKVGKAGVRKATTWSAKSASVDKVYKPTLPKYCFSATTYQSVLTDYSSSADLGLVTDLSELPRPRHTLMTRELPYVYRFKIQQGITSLSNMIPTKRSQTSANIW